MRRLLIPAALLAAAVAFLALGPAWRERAGPTRAVAPAPNQTASGSFASEVSSAPPVAGEAGDAEGAEAQAVVRGVVTGPMGVLWCARVVAYRGERVMAEAWTNPKGLCTLAVEPGVEFDFAVEPAPETGLLAVRRAALPLERGEERVEDVAVETGEELRGQLVDPEGRGCGGIELFAVRPENFAGVEGTSERTALATVAAAYVRTSRSGGYWLRGLEAGPYSLAICSRDWMFPAPVSARTDGPELSLVVVPALTVDLDVRDVETGQPLDAFSVTVRQGDRVILEGTGTAGVFSRRMPFPGERDPRALVFVEVAAPGFLSPGQLVNSGKGTNVVWLIPRRDPNTTVRVSFDNREPYLGDLFAQFRMREGPGGTGQVWFKRVREGVYRGALPYGRWDLELMPAALLGQQRFPAEAEVGAGREAEVALVLPAGGSILLSAPARAKEPLVWVRSATEAEKGDSGRPFHVPPEGVRIEGIPPATYQVGYASATEEGRFGVALIWFKDVRIEVGSTEEVAVPAE